jgi:hypothetical protein
MLIIEVGQAQAVLIHDQFYPARLFSAIAGAWPVAYQRSDRTSLPLASDPRWHESTPGTFRTCRDGLTMSAHRGKADIPPQGRDFRF